MAARILGIGAMAAAILLCAPAAAQLYKWTDDEGRVHYSDNAPDRRGAKKLDVRISSLSGPATVTTQPAKPPAAGGRPAVRMLTTAACGYCIKARAHLSGKGIAFEDLDVEKSTAARQEFTALKGRGVPIILVGNRRMDGFNAAALDKMLQAAGY